MAIPRLCNTALWTGLGADPLFSNPDNWTVASPPAPGDALVFDNAPILSPFNDFATDTPFSDLTFASTATASFNLTGNRILLNGNITSNSTQPQLLALPLHFSATPAFSIAGSASLTLTGSNLLPNGLLKTGLGILTLAGSNSASAPITISLGTLALDFSQPSAPADNVISGTPSLALGGAVTSGNISLYQLSLIGASSSANSQSFNSTTFNTGASVISVSAGATGSAVLNLGTLTHTLGSAALFILPASGNITTTATNSHGILGAWATVGNGTISNGIQLASEWAAVDPAGNIVAFTNYVDYASGNLAGNVSLDTNLRKVGAAAQPSGKH